MFSKQQTAFNHEVNRFRKFINSALIFTMYFCSFKMSEGNIIDELENKRTYQNTKHIYTKMTKIFSMLWLQIIAVVPNLFRLAGPNRKEI